MSFLPFSFIQWQPKCMGPCWLLVRTHALWLTLYINHFDEGEGPGGKTSLMCLFKIIHLYYAGQKAWHLDRRQLVVTLFGRLCIYLVKFLFRLTLLSKTNIFLKRLVNTSVEMKKLVSFLSSSLNVEINFQSISNWASCIIAANKHRQLARRLLEPRLLAAIVYFKCRVNA